MYRDNSISIQDLIGRNIVNVEGLSQYSDEIRFICDDGTIIFMFHQQSCCESVSLEDFIFPGYENGERPHGKVISAEERTNSTDLLSDKKDQHIDSFTYTFYEIAFPNGTLQLRWFGESNGFYSESVDFSIRKLV